MTQSIAVGGRCQAICGARAGGEGVLEPGKETAPL